MKHIEGGWPAEVKVQDSFYFFFSIVFDKTYTCSS